MRLIVFLLSGFLAMLLPAALSQVSLADAPIAKPLVYEVGGNVTSPKLVHTVVPTFTQEAQKHRVQGTTVVSLIVDEQGKPQEVRVARSLAEKVDPKYRAIAQGLDDEVVEAVRQYLFQPGLLEKKPVAVALRLKVDFQLF